MRTALAGIAAAGLVAVIWFGFLAENDAPPPPEPPEPGSALPARESTLEFSAGPVASDASARVGDGLAVLNGRVTRDGSPTTATLTMERAGRSRYAWTAPVEDVLSAPASPGEPLARLKTGPDGRFRLIGLAPGEYRIRAEADGARAGRSLAIYPGTSPRPVYLKLLPADITLRGRALHEDDRPFRGLVVIGSTIARTDEEGRFRLGGLTAGKTTVYFLEPDVFSTAVTVTLPHEGELLVRVEKGMRTATGRVVAAEDDTPIPGASVFFTDYGRGGITQTDEMGHFRLLAPERRAWLTARANGFVEGAATVQSEAETVIRLLRPGRVAGRVLDADGAARPGVPVFLEESGQRSRRAHRRTTSDESGAFEFDDVTPGVASLYAFGAGVVSEALPEVTGWVNPLTIDVPVGGAVEKDLVVISTATVHGRIIDEAGEPVGGIPVEARPEQRYQRQGVRDAVSGADGVFEIEGMIPGCPYGFSAVSDRGLVSKAGPVEVESGATGEVEIRLLGPRWIDLTARDATNGKPIAGAGVTVRQEGGVAHFLTDAHGRARLGPLLPLDARIRLDHGGYLWSEEQMTVPVDGPDRIEVDLEPGFRISGVVLEVGGTPLNGRTVILQGTNTDPGNPWATSQRTGQRTGEDGSFRLGPVPAGEYEIVIFGRRGERGRFPVRAGDEDLVLLVNPAPEPPPVPEKTALGEFTVRFSGPDGRPPVGGRVTMHPLGGLPPPECIESGPGLARYAIRELGDRVLVEVSGAAGSDGKPLGEVLLGPIDLKPGEVEVRLERGTEIRGRVVGPNGEGMRGLLVLAARVLPPDAGRPNNFARARSGNGGAFVLEGIGDGPHRIEVKPPPEYTDFTPVDATAGDTDVRLELRSGATLEIRLVDMDGRPVAGNLVLVRPRTDPPRSRTEFTDDDGVATFHRLDPTVPVAVRASGPGGTAALVEEVDAGSGEVVIRLRPGGEIRGSFRVPEGATRFRAGAWLEGIRAAGEAGADGEFVIRGLSPGVWEIRIVAQGPDRAFWSGSAKARPGERTSVELERQR